MCIKRVVRLSIRKSIGGKVRGKDWKQQRVVAQVPGQIYSGKLHLGRQGSNNVDELLPPRAPSQSQMALCLPVSVCQAEEATVLGTTDHRHWLYRQHLTSGAGRRQVLQMTAQVGTLQAVCQLPARSLAGSQYSCAHHGMHRVVASFGLHELRVSARPGSH